MNLRDFIKLIWKYLDSKKKLTAWCIFLIGFTSVLSAFIPQLYGKLVDLAVTTPVDIKLIGILAVVWLGFTILANWVTRFVDYQASFLGFEVYKNFLVDMYDHYLQLPMSFHKEKKSGEQIQKIDRGADFLWQAIGNALFYLMPAMLTAIVVLIIVFITEYRLAIILMLILVGYTYITIKKVKPIALSRKKTNKLWDKIWGDIYDTIGNISLVKAHIRESVETKNVVVRLDKMKKDQVNLWRAYRSMESWQTNLESLGFIIIFILAVVLLINNKITAGLLVSFVGYVNLAFRPFDELANIYKQLEQGIVTVGRTLEILKVDKELYQGGKKLKNIQGKIEFKKVSFSYGGKNKKVLKNISFKAEGGQMIALVGESGTGKTTLLSLLSRYYEPIRGQIYLEGVNIKEINLVFLRSLIALVPQEISLFNETLKNNLKYAKKKATEKEITEALKVANAWEFVEKFPKKLEQVVGERGIKLSTGQKQRIAIARAVLRNPKILILDEATSALDSISEKLVQEALKKVATGRTTFVIAHRLSTIVHADKILVFAKGKLEEVGTHEELVRKKGVYAKLYQQQKF